MNTQIVLTEIPHNGSRVQYEDQIDKLTEGNEVHFVKDNWFQNRHYHVSMTDSTPKVSFQKTWFWTFASKKTIAQETKQLEDFLVNHPKLISARSVQMFHGHSSSESPQEKHDSTTSTSLSPKYIPIEAPTRSFTDSTTPRSDISARYDTYSEQFSLTFLKKHGHKDPEKIWKLLSCMPARERYSTMNALSRYAPNKALTIISRFSESDLSALKPCYQKQSDIEDNSFLTLLAREGNRYLLQFMLETLTPSQLSLLTLQFQQNEYYIEALGNYICDISKTKHFSASDTSVEAEKFKLLFSVLDDHNKKEMLNFMASQHRHFKVPPNLKKNTEVLFYSLPHQTQLNLAHGLTDETCEYLHTKLVHQENQAQRSYAKHRPHR
ncbi:hypothetical protein SOPP22_14825 [Shewanella sp. OPT22]|nr:hypothetical protein SOPP22_14825 [Shewanella sp. OPT22]